MGSVIRWTHQMKVVFQLVWGMKIRFAVAVAVVAIGGEKSHGKNEG